MSRKEVQKKQRQVPYYNIIDGVPRGPYCEPECLRNALNFKPRDGDVILVAYPKSGSHWVQQVMLLILNKGESATDYYDHIEKAAFMEMNGTPELLDKMPSPRMMRTNLPILSRNSCHKNAKYVYMARNPWDCSVSFYHHVKGIAKFRFENGSFEDFLDCFLEGNFGFGDYFDHILAGYEMRNEPNVFFSTYEQFKQDTPGSIRKLAYFLGEEYGKLLDRDENIFKQVMEKSSPEFMKKIMEFESTDSTDGKQQDVKVFNFVRKAKVGDWKHYFNRELLQKMAAKIEEKTKGSDIMDLWKRPTEQDL